MSIQLTLYDLFSAGFDMLTLKLLCWWTKARTIDLRYGILRMWMDLAIEIPRVGVQSMLSVGCRRSLEAVLLDPAKVFDWSGFEFLR